MNDLQLPCCTYSALVLYYSQTGKLTSVPSFARGEMPATLWGRLNVWNGNDPWSVITASAEYANGWASFFPEEDDDLEFTPGCWHVVQHWKSLEDGIVGPASFGHTTLVWFSGYHYIVHESSVSKGYRETSYKEFNRKPGREYGIATLPRDTPFALENALSVIPFGGE